MLTCKQKFNYLNICEIFRKNNSESVTILSDHELSEREKAEIKNLKESEIGSYFQENRLQFVSHNFYELSF